MISLIEIQDFLAPKRMAIAGASRNAKKFGGMIFQDLQKKGYQLYPVHPEANEIQGVACFRSVSDLPAEAEMLYIVTPKSQTLSIVQQAVERGVKKIWIQQSSDTPEAIDWAKQHNLPVISGQCMFMFAEPVSSIHGFHRWLNKVFRSYPR
jgi:uncharacterized protein